MLNTLLIVFLVLVIIGSLPVYGYSSGWGYWPAGGVGLLLVIILVLVLMGQF
jgi:hypothetical protein